MVAHLDYAMIPVGVVGALRQLRLWLPLSEVSDFLDRRASRRQGRLSMASSRAPLVAK